MTRTLPWHYLGDIASIIYYGASTAQSECEGGLSEEDIRSLIAEPGKISPTDDDSIVIALVRAEVKKAEEEGRRKSWATWEEWPENLKVIPCRGMPPELDTEDRGQITRREHDFILGPSHLILPWPFSPLRNQELELGKDSDLSKAYHVEDWDSKKHYEPETDVLGDALLGAADWLVVPPTREDEISYKLTWPGDPDVREKLIVRARTTNKGFDLPSSVFTYAVDIPTFLTNFEIGRRAITLALGATPSPPPDIVGMTEYPCGAFEP